jgi:hypothetical protein
MEDEVVIIPSPPTVEPRNDDRLLLSFEHVAVLLLFVLYSNSILPHITHSTSIIGIRSRTSSARMCGTESSSVNCRYLVLPDRDTIQEIILGPGAFQNEEVEDTCKVRLQEKILRSLAFFG